MCDPLLSRRESCHFKTRIREEQLPAPRTNVFTPSLYRHIGSIRAHTYTRIHEHTLQRDTRISSDGDRAQSRNKSKDHELFTAFRSRARDRNQKVGSKREKGKNSAPIGVYHVCVHTPLYLPPRFERQCEIS